MVNKDMMAYHVNKDVNEVVLVNVLHEACYEKYDKDYLLITYLIM